MREEFQKRRGYDMLPFLPALTGRVVGSLEISERFLWDLRQTAGEMVIENYAGHMAELAHKNGLRLSIEAYGGPCDDITYGGRADEPMGEFWIGGGAWETLKAMASSAHIYGRPILGAEAFTAGDRERWQQHPGSIKALGDRAFTEGVNRFVFHRYAMQPWLDYRAGHDHGAVGPPLRADEHLVGDGRAVARVSRALPVHAAPGDVRRRHPLPPAGGLAAGIQVARAEGL